MVPSVPTMLPKVFTPYTVPETRPERAGSRQIEGGRWLYHLRSSRGRLFGSGVRAPRHFLLYRHDDVRVELLRVLHDAMDLPARLTDDA